MPDARFEPKEWDGQVCSFQNLMQTQRNLVNCMLRQDKGACRTEICPVLKNGV